MNYKNNMNRIIMIYFLKLCYYKKTYETTLNKNFIMFLLTTSYCNLKKFCKGPAWNSTSSTNKLCLCTQEAICEIRLTEQL